MSTERKSRERKRGDDECRERIMNGVLSVGSLVIVFVCLIKRKASDNRVNMNRQCADCAALILWYFDSAVIGCWCPLSCVRLIKRKMDDKGRRERAMNGPWGGGCSLSLNQADKVVTPHPPIHPHISSALNVCFSGEYSDEPRRRLFCPSKIMLGRLQDKVRFGEQKELATQHKNECLTRQVN